MATSTIHVNQNGRPTKGAKIKLSFATGGITGAVKTNSKGIATIDHEGTGTATIFVNGSKRGTFVAPGSITVERDNPASRPKNLAQHIQRH